MLLQDEDDVCCGAVERGRDEAESVASGRLPAVTDSHRCGIHFGRSCQY